MAKTGKIKYSSKFKRNYVAFFALFLFFFMIIGELLLAASIPMIVSREEMFSREIRRREMLLLFDSTRRICDDIPEKNETIQLEKRLLSAAMDQLTIYLRDEAEHLTPEDVDTLFPLITELYKTANRLSKGRAFSRESKIDTAAYINSLISKQTERRDE